MNLREAYYNDKEGVSRMKRRSVRKKIVLVIISLIAYFIIYIGLSIYQTNHLEIISLEEMSQLKVSSAHDLDGNTRITGTADVDDFEAVALMDAMVVEETLYLILYKWPAFIEDSTIDFSLENIEGLDEVNRVSIVYGEIYSGEGEQYGISYGDFLSHPDQSVIWKKGEEN